MALTARASVELVATLTGSADFGAPSSRVRFADQLDFSSGNGAGEADILWTDQRTIAASGSDTIDLTATLEDVFGGSLTFARIKALYVRAASGNTNDVVLGDDDAPWSTLLGTDGTVTLKPGSVFFVGNTGATAWAVTATTADILQVANSSSGSSVTYDIAIVGATAE